MSAGRDLDDLRALLAETAAALPPEHAELQRRAWSLLDRTDPEHDESPVPQ